MSAWERFLRLLFPPRCAACDSLLPFDAPHGTALCAKCLADWKNDARETCGICLKTVDQCACVTEPMRRARCTTLRKLIYYRGRRRDVVQNRLLFHIKDVPDRHAIRFCAERLFVCMREELNLRGCPTDSCVVTYLPRSSVARAKNGTDQACELARALSLLSGIACVPLIQRRRGQNRPQKRLRYAERIQNAKATYTLANGADAHGLTVFLVDDIVTSGAGMAQGVRLLRRAGAAEVICLSVAVDEINRERDVSGAEFEERYASTRG